MQLTGIHHLSAITEDAQKNYDFYAKVLGLRLIKKTVNQDSPEMYHLFFGDEIGNPGTELTFFEIASAPMNKIGNNSISLTSLRVPSDIALDYWIKRFDQYDILYDEITTFNHAKTLYFEDPEGQRLMLISDENETNIPTYQHWAGSPIEEKYAIRGLGPIRLTVPYLVPTAQFLIKVMGFHDIGPLKINGNPSKNVTVFETGKGGNSSTLYIEERKDIARASEGIGGVHHLALRVQTEAELKAWVERIDETGLVNSGFVDRFYFKSLYIREPNGILFELATDGPGFTTDESVETLGEKLSLPPFLEQERHLIERKLKPLQR